MGEAVMRGLAKLAGWNGAGTLMDECTKCGVVWAVLALSDSNPYSHKRVVNSWKRAECCPRCYHYVSAGNPNYFWYMP